MDWFCDMHPIARAACLVTTFDRLWANELGLDCVESDVHEATRLPIGLGLAVSVI